LNESSSLRETGHVSLAGVPARFSSDVKRAFCRLTSAPSHRCVFIITNFLENFKIFWQMKIDPSELVSQPEAAKMRGVSIQAIHELMKRGRLTVVEISGKRFLLKKEVEAFEPHRTGRPRKNPAADQSKQGPKPTKRGSAAKTKSAKKKKAR
jgi:hypothetical protein